MRIIKAYTDVISPSLDHLDEINDIYQRIEYAGRTCYKSTDRITPISARSFVRKIVQNHHEAMLEHASVTVRFVVDRGVSHELVRHRLASYAQESTRYCNYSKDKFGNELTFIEPCFWTDARHELQMKTWESWMQAIENQYIAYIQGGATPQEARCLLPNSLKTEVIMTANLREWRHFFRLRAAGVTGAPHPQMMEVSVPLFLKLRKAFPEVFDDIVVPTDILKKYGGVEE